MKTIISELIFRYIGFTLLYFKMAVISLVPETKIVDVGKLISRTYWSGKSRDLCLQQRPHL